MNIHEKSTKMKRLSKYHKPPKYCAGLPSLNQPMLLNACDDIGISKADQSNFYFPKESRDNYVD